MGWRTAVVATGLLISSAAAAPQAKSQVTDFGVRLAPSGGTAVSQPAATRVRPAVAHGSAFNLSSAVALASSWGRVTSTLRTPAHNRAVGGVRNSYHLRGRAIDIARRPGVRHGDIAAAFRRAGYWLVESLDEGDHSHFAFGWGSPAVRPLTLAKREPAESTQWRIVLAPGVGSH